MRSDSSVIQDEEVRELWPRLTRFYGLSYEELKRLPRIILDRYTEMMPMLQADEQVRALEASAYPHVDAETARSIYRFWVNVRTAGFAALSTSEVKKPSHPGDISQLGIEVVHAPSRESGSLVRDPWEDEL